MASRWPAVGTSTRRRSLQSQEQLEESEALQPAVGHPDSSSGALDSLCRQFQRRLPLRAVSLNLRAGPSWKRLETPEPGQPGLQAAARSAKSALGAVSQVMSNVSRTSWCAEVLGAWPGDSGVAHSWLVRADLSVYLSQRIQESCQSGTKWLVETQSDSDLEPMGAGIQHLQKLSQELDEAIIAEE
ncbi:hypothetical protein E2I00_017846, partial [Balaenoptera physalus]